MNLPSPIIPTTGSTIPTGSSPPLTPTLTTTTTTMTNNDSSSSSITSYISGRLSSVNKPPTPAPSPQPRSRVNSTRIQSLSSSSWTCFNQQEDSNSTEEEEEKELIDFLRLTINSKLSLPGRDRLLTLLIKETSPTLLSSLMHLVITPRLKRDFLKTLPIELSFHVLSFVDDVKTLTSASRVSRFWRALLEDEHTWKRMCWKSGFGSAPKPPPPPPTNNDFNYYYSSFENRIKNLQLEQGQQQQARAQDDEEVMFTPAGRERRGTLDRVGLSEFAARAELFDLPVAVRRGSTQRVRETSWSDAAIPPPPRQDSSSSSSSSIVHTGLGFATSILSGGGGEGGEASTTSRNRRSSSTRAAAAVGPNELVSPPMFSLPSPAPPLPPTATESSSIYSRLPNSSTRENDQEDNDSFTPTTTNSHSTTRQQQQQDPSSSLMNMNPFSYKTHFKRAYLTESNWLRGPGRLLSTQMSAENDGVVTSLGFDDDWIVVGMATSKIHVFEAEKGRYVRSLEGHDLGVWCLTLVSSKVGGGGDTKGKGKGKEYDDITQEEEEEELFSKHHHQRSNTTNSTTDKNSLPRFNIPPRRRRRSFPSFSVPPSSSPPSRDQFGGMGLGAGGKTGGSEGQSSVCSTASGWGQSSARVVSGGCDREVRVWDVETGECLHVLRGHSSTVRCMRVLNGRPIAVSGSRDSTLRVWDLQQGKCLHLLSGHEHSVRCIEVNGNKVVSGSYDATCRLWDVDTGECLHVFRGHIHQIYAVAFDGIRVVTGSLDSTVRIWDAQTGEFLALLQGHTSLVGQLILLPPTSSNDNNEDEEGSSSGPTLITGGSDGRVIVFDLNTFETIHRLCAHDNSVTCLQVDQRFIVTGGNDGRIKLWDFKTGKLLRELLEPPCGAVWRVVFRDDKSVTLCRREGKTLMDVRTFRPSEQELFG